MFRVIIAGGRDFQDYSLLQQTINDFLNCISDKIVIICGKARGADTLGEQYANERGYAVRDYPADWHQYGKAAGYIRNKEMAQNADALVAFWDGHSRGTKNMIELAQRNRLELRVINY